MTANFKIGAMLRNQRAKESREHKQSEQAEKAIRISEKWFSNVTGEDDAVCFGKKGCNRVGRYNLSFDQGGVYVKLNGAVKVVANDVRDPLVVQFKMDIIDSDISFRFKNKIEVARFMALAEQARITIAV